MVLSHTLVGLSGRYLTKMIIYAVTSTYEAPEAYFTTEAKAEEYISNAIAKQKAYNLEHGTDYHFQDELYTEEIEVN